MVADPRHFLLNTNYPMDKISGFYEDFVSVASGATATPSVAHGLGYAPLYFVKWSTNANFTTSFDELGTSTINNLQFSAQTDATNLYLFADNDTGSAVNFYYRVIYFMPTNVDMDADSTQAGLDTFVLNTRYNYTKVYDEDYIASSTGTINHDLGYYPQVEAWYVRSADSRIVHCISGELYPSPTTPRVRVTTSQVIFDNGSSVAASGWHYKIYADEV